MPKGRLVFDGDNIYTEKDARIYKLKTSVSSKIDAIPGVVDSLDSTSTTDALSANMGRTLQDQINSLSGTGKFLSTWDCTTGLPGTNPQEDPYTYKVGDYYVVSAVGSTNYKPHGGTYTQGVPSTTVELENVGINDKYYFDGADWVRIPNAAIQITIDSALSVSSTNAVENRAIANAVNAKQDIISDLNTIRSGASAGATALQPNDNISQLTNNVGYQTAGDVASAIAGKQDILSAGDGISISNNTVTNTKPGPAISGTAPSNPTEGTLWYDSTNDVLKVYDGSAWQEVGSDAADINTKTFYLSSTSDLINAQATYDWFLAGKNPIIVYNNTSYTLRSVVDNSNIVFMGYRTQGTIDGDKTVSAYKTVQFTINSNVVTAIILNNDFDQTAYLSTNVNYTSPYIPQYPGSPATKKYVDDSVADIISSGSTQPANPQEGDLWYDTVNHVLKIYNGTSWETVDTDTNTTYTAGSGISIDANNEISVDTSIIATKSYADGVVSDAAYSSSRDGDTTHSPSKNAVYDKVHAIEGDISTLQTNVTNLGAGKQDTLVSGTNIKTINNESILGSGNITVSGGLPSGGSVGQVVSKKSDGAGWSTMSIVEEDYTAMQGPCASGFHVPNIDGVNNLKSAILNLGITGDSIREYLKMPSTGWIVGINGNRIENQPGYRTVNNASYPYSTRNSILFGPNMGTSVATRSNGWSIRPFKDVPSIPDGRWTVIYQGTGSAGIYHNSTLGLISISGDGITWITIADKNLGATTVYNSGDTLSEANCGKYYQWGNNHGFPFTGSFTTSSTLVDVSNYGPGNYYSSSTFIYGPNDSTQDWSSVQNNNLWGGVTGVIEKGTPYVIKLS